LASSFYFLNWNYAFRIAKLVLTSLSKELIPFFFDLTLIGLLNWEISLNLLIFKETCYSSSSFISSMTGNYGLYFNFSWWSAAFFYYSKYFRCLSLAWLNFLALYLSLQTLNTRNKNFIKFTITLMMTVITRPHPTASLEGIVSVG
jgi:hypothetical protein